MRYIVQLNAPNVFFLKKFFYIHCILNYMFYFVIPESLFDFL